MEYIEGETLAHRLLKGALPLEQVLQYAIQIADALDKAHRMGVTHRDLKPANVMLTKSGTKLLDFGLAKLKTNSAPPSPLSDLPTAKDNITAQGTIIGTLQYMAPEQLEGKEVDARTDIFALRIDLRNGRPVRRAFDEVSCKRHFRPSCRQTLLLCPPCSQMSPPALDRLVKRCLAKGPGQEMANGQRPARRAAVDRRCRLESVGVSGSNGHSRNTQSREAPATPGMVRGGR